jgi:cytosine/adenosine deaminase-related metal-dependent hydrolase
VRWIFGSTLALRQCRRGDDDELRGRGEVKDYLLSASGEFDADIDMHVDETDDPMARTLEVLAELTIRNGWQGRASRSWW